MSDLELDNEKVPKNKKKSKMSLIKNVSEEHSKNYYTVGKKYIFPHPYRTW